MYCCCSHRFKALENPCNSNRQKVNFLKTKIFLILNFLKWRTIFGEIKCSKKSFFQDTDTVSIYLRNIFSKLQCILIIILQFSCIFERHINMISITSSNTETLFNKRQCCCRFILSEFTTIWRKCFTKFSRDFYMLKKKYI